VHYCGIPLVIFILEELCLDLESRQVVYLLMNFRPEIIIDPITMYS
jgi:hypothetical protein